MVFLLPPVQLKHQLAAHEEALVVPTAVAALAAEELLVPSAARFNVIDANQRLWSHSWLAMMPNMAGNANQRIGADAVGG